MNNTKSILASEQALLTAMKNSDVPALTLLLHDDLLFNIPTGATITKAMDLESYLSDTMFVEEISSEEPTIQLIGDTSIVAVTVHLKGKYADQPIDGTFRYLRVWKHLDDRWQVIAGSCLMI